MTTDIRYHTLRHRLTLSLVQEQRRLCKALYHVLLEECADDVEEADYTAHVSTLLADLLDIVSQLCTDITRQRRFPIVPSDPEEQAQMWQEATAELFAVWGYHDITAQVRDWYECYAHERGEPTRFDALLVLKSPRSVQYVRSLSDLLIVLDEARQADADHPFLSTTDNTAEEDDDAPRL